MGRARRSGSRSRRYLSEQSHLGDRPQRAAAAGENTRNQRRTRPTTGLLIHARQVAWWPVASISRGEELQVDGISHDLIACVVRVQMIAGIVRRQEPGR